jgi:hypothetical protein
MYPNFEEILGELSYKVGIVDLTNESHKTQLVKLLREKGIPSAQQLADRASVVFEYIQEATKPDKALAARSKDSGKLIYFGSKDAKADAIKAGTHTDPAQPTQQSEPKQTQKLSGSDFKSSAEKNSEPTKEPQSKSSSSKKVKRVNDDIRKQNKFNTDKTMAVGLGDAESESKTSANNAKKINENPVFTEEVVNNIFDNNPKFPKKYLAVMDRIMEYGPENVSITMLTDKAGAGTLPSTCGEIIGMAGLSIQDTNKRKEFFDILRKRSIENGKDGIVDVSWINSAEAHCAAADRKLKRDFPNGYTIQNTFWDVQDEADAVGVENYKQNKGFSTDVNMLVMDNKTKETKWIEPSLKKNESVNLLNGTTNRIRSIAVLASNNVTNEEKDQYESATKELEALGEVKKGKTPEWARKEELQKYVSNVEDRVKDEIPKEASADYASETQRKIHESTWENEDTINESKKILTDWANLDSKQKRDKTFEIIKGMGQNPNVNLVNEVQNTLNTMSQNQDGLNTKDGLYSLGRILKTGNTRDIQKASVIMMNLAGVSENSPLLSESKDKVYENSNIHSKAACEYLLSTEENKSALLRSIREAFPIKSLLDGEENMFLGDNKKGKTPGTNIDQFVLKQVFEVNSANEFQAGLKIFETPPPPHISYVGKGKNSKPIEIAQIKSRSDGKGYGGTWKLEMSLSKSFVDICKEYDV